MVRDVSDSSAPWVSFVSYEIRALLRALDGGAASLVSCGVGCLRGASFVSRRARVLMRAVRFGPGGSACRTMAAAVRPGWDNAHAMSLLARPPA